VGLTLKKGGISANHQKLKKLSDQEADGFDFKEDKKTPAVCRGSGEIIFKRSRLRLSDWL
jgi:hypothetical protein